MMCFGNSLQKSYKTETESTVKNDFQKTQEEKDREALRKAAEAKRAERLARMEQRDKSRIPLDKKLEKEAEEYNDEILKTAKENTNYLARKYNLPEPNNPEALNHDRLYCYTCNRRLDSPNAYKQDEDLQKLFDDEEVRTLCCWCFGRMDDDDIKFTSKTGEEATKEIRLAVYNPEVLLDADITEEDAKRLENVPKSRQIYIKSKIKRYKNVVNMIGSIKHNSLEDEEHTDLSFLKQFKTRYDACTL